MHSVVSITLRGPVTTEFSTSIVVVIWYFILPFKLQCATNFLLLFYLIINPIIQLHLTLYLNSESPILND